MRLNREVVWPGSRPGFYGLSFSEFRYSVACVHRGGITSGGGTIMHVRLPPGQALVRSLTPGARVNAHGMAVRLDRVSMGPEGTQLSLSSDDSRLPVVLEVSLLIDGQELAPRPGGVSYRQGNGAQVFAAFAPVPVGTHALTVRLSATGPAAAVAGLRGEGPWEIAVPLA